MSFTFRDGDFWKVRRRANFLVQLSDISSNAVIFPKLLTVLLRWFLALILARTAAAICVCEIRHSSISISWRSSRGKTISN